MGTLADRFGRRRLFVIGVGLFTFASLLCGLSTSADLLQPRARPAGRRRRGDVRDLAGADRRRRSRAASAAPRSAIWGATIGGAVAVGPLVGGVLAERVGWEWIFFVNVPIGIGTVILVPLTQVGESRDPEAKRLDWAGLVTFSLGLFALDLRACCAATPRAGAAR